jgi:hypothetical protein
MPKPVPRKYNQRPRSTLDIRYDDKHVCYVRLAMLVGVCPPHATLQSAPQAPVQECQGSENKKILTISGYHFTLT